MVNNCIYIGKHSSNDIDNDPYMGSGIALCHSIKLHGKDKFLREILYQFSNQDQAYLMQANIVTEQFVKRKDVYNCCLGGIGGSRGMVTVQDEFGLKFQVFIDDPRYLSGELIHINKGRKLNRQKYPTLFNGQNHVSYGTIWINNPVTGQNLRVKKNNSIPKGWKLGKAQRSSQNYSGHRGTIWITEASTGKNKRHNSKTDIPLGWKRGRYNSKQITKQTKSAISQSKRGKIAINNNVVTKYILPQEFELFESKGWKKGMIARR